MSNQSIEDASAVGDRLPQERNSNLGHLAAWRYFASIAVMAAIWGLLLLIAWEGKPGILLAILLVYSVPFAATSQLALLISLPVLPVVVRAPLSLALMSAVVWLTIYFFELYQQDELYLWLAVFSIQFSVVMIAGVVGTRFSGVGARSTRRFSLQTLIMTVTIVCVSLGLVRAIVAALEMNWEDFMTSEILNHLSLALLNSTAVIGPLMAMASRRVLLRVLCLIVGAPLSILLSLAIVALHHWATSNGQIFNYTEAAIFSGIQAVAVSLSLLPIVLAKPIQTTIASVDSPPASVLQQES